MHALIKFLQGFLGRKVVCRGWSKVLSAKRLDDTHGYVADSFECAGLVKPV